MKIVIISSARAHVSAETASGLGRSLHDLAAGLKARGHDVHVTTDEDESVLAGDVYLDGSHAHKLSVQLPGLPVLNRIGDRECTYMPPNAVVASDYMARRYSRGRVIPTGIDVRSIPVSRTAGAHVAWMGLDVPHKGLHTARQAASGADVELRAAGEGTILGVLAGEEKWRFLGAAAGLLHPSMIDAAPRTPLEAAACGTPTICLDGDGAAEHVEHCTSGFVCSDIDDMADAIADLELLDRWKVRAWVAETHPLDKMLDRYEAALTAIADGERW